VVSSKFLDTNKLFSKILDAIYPRVNPPLEVESGAIGFTRGWMNPKNIMAINNEKHS
jgi:hypothetical protein